jgi:hypothetical protein
MCLPRSTRQPLGAAATLALVSVAVACGGDKPADIVGEAAAPSPRLYLAGDGELWIVDVARERVRHVRLRELGPGDHPERIVRRGRRLGFAGRTTTYVADPGFRRPVRTLASRAWFFIPSAHPGRVWVAFLMKGTSRRVNAIGAVREVTAAGRVTVPDVRPLGGRWPERALTSGLLFSARGGSAWVLWDPVTRSVLRRLPGRAIGDLGPAHGDLLASCPWPCRSLRLTDASSGARREVAAPPGVRFEVWTAQFSPDGRRLAVAVRRHGAGRRAAGRLALIDVARGAASVVADSTVPAGYTLVAWSADGRHVFITGGERFRPRTIAAHHLGTARARTLDVAVGDFYDVAAL